MTTSTLSYLLGFASGFGIWPLAYVVVRHELRALRGTR